MEDNAEITLSAQGIFDAVKLLDKDLIDKVLTIAKMVRFEKPEPGVTRIIIDIKDQN